MVKNPPANAEDMSSIPEWGRSFGGGNGNLLQYSYPGKATDRSLEGYSPCGCKESDTSEHAHMRCTHARCRMRVRAKCSSRLLL